MKNVGSLFSGIGGLDLGFSREGFATKWFIEDNPYCQAVLRKNFPNISIYGDIKEVDFRKLERVDILTGGFPCQDISSANPRGEGITGERSGLWSYYAEAIGEIRPEYAVIENVPMLANRGLNVVLGDLAKNGYDAEWFCLRASDFGALHRRERLFVIAYPASTGMEGNDGCGSQNIEGRGNRMGAGELERCASSDIDEQLRDEIHGQQPNDERGVTPNLDHQRQPQLQRGKQDIRGRDNNCVKTLNTPNFDCNGSREDANRVYVSPSKIRGEIYTKRPSPKISPSPNSNSGQHKHENQAVCSRRDTTTPRFITHDWNERIQRFCAESLQGEQGFSWCQDVRRIEDLQGRTDIPQPLFRGGRDGATTLLDRFGEGGNEMDRDSLILGALKLGRINVDFESGQVYSTRQRGKEGIEIPLKGSLVSGYTVHRLYLDGIKKQVRAHRIVWMAKYGKIPKDKCIDHINRVRTDNRLQNLRIVSIYENAMNRRSFCGENNPSAKLTEKEVMEIRTLISESIPYQEIAEDYGVSKSEVGNIAKGVTWNPKWMDRIKCCGNAVVPQVAQFIARRIKEIEEKSEEK